MVPSLRGGNAPVFGIAGRNDNALHAANGTRTPESAAQSAHLVEIFIYPARAAGHVEH